MGLREKIIFSVLIRDGLGDQVVGVDDRQAAGLLFDSIDEVPSLCKAHVFRPVSAFQIQRNQVVGLGLYGFQKKVGLLNRITGLAVVVRAPLVATLLRFNFTLGIFAVGAISDGRAMNNGDDALVGGKLLPVD